MLPLGEDVQSDRRLPFVTIALILGMVAISLVLNGPGHESQLREVTSQWGLVPKRFWADPASTWPTFLTSSLLHANFVHLATNMLFLWVFGRGLEHELRWAYLPFYAASAVTAGLASALLRASSDVPGIGASGAISGVLGAYLILLPSADIRALVLVPWGLILAVLRGDSPIWSVPAWTAILTWFVLQVVELIAPAAFRSGTDYAAHVGGFLFGYASIRVARGVFGLWPDEPTYQRVLDRPLGYDKPLPNSYVRARRLIPQDVPIQADDIEWVVRSGYVDPDVVPGYDGKALIGRRLRAPRYRYEPIRRSDLAPADEEMSRA